MARAPLCGVYFLLGKPETRDDKFQEVCEPFLPQGWGVVHHSQGRFLNQISTCSTCRVACLNVQELGKRVEIREKPSSAEGGRAES